ncbi:phosphodiester glycosidase family protein [Rhodosalinus sp. FB01]|uniref:phosphodiester glycosidase family protein n=1 Tax=Rhodosalinus sp. FB01 TaxID=3239194 RepID=UPI003524B25F
MIRGLAALAFTLALAGGAHGVECRDLTHDGIPYTVCEVDPAREELRLFHAGADGVPYGHFSTLERALGARGRHLAFAMNAGMYHQDRAPVGLYVEDGEQTMSLVTSAGPGNFGLLPNGVLCIEAARARVIETRRFAETGPECRHATQSGPMLVIDGALHPRFLADSTSRFMRNGVGATEAGDRVVFAISGRPVTFHEFGRLFRDRLGLPQALYLDGNVSRLYAPGLGRSDLGRWMGPIVAVVEPAAD